MSNSASNWAFLQLPAGSEEFKTSAALEKVTLMVLADFHNSETTQCNPSARLVGKLCCCNEKTVRRCLDSLQAQGFIWLTKHERKAAEIRFNWHRPGAHEWHGQRPGDDQNRSTDTMPAEPKEAPAMPDWARAAEDQKPSTDTMPVEAKSADMATPICGHDDANLRTWRPQSAGTVPDRTLEPLEPGSEPVATRPPPDPLDPDAWRHWTPTREQREALRLAAVQFTDDDLAAYRLDLMGRVKKPFSWTTDFKKFIAFRRQDSARAGKASVTDHNAAVVDEYLRSRGLSHGN